MSNLELDEEVLTDLLELPTWLKITRAFCNRVAMKVRNYWLELRRLEITFKHLFIVSFGLVYNANKHSGT